MDNNSVDQQIPLMSDRIKDILNSLSLCKSEYVKEKEECKRVRELNAKLESELKSAKESEKSHRYNLMNSREMIENLQETVSQLVYLKRDVKKMSEEIAHKEFVISSLTKEKETEASRHNDFVSELRNTHSKQIEELTALNERKMQEVQHNADTQVAQFTCAIEELRAKLKDTESSHRDKLNIVVLEYEEKLQRSSAQITQLHDQHAGLVARTDANMDAYRRRLEELEEKLKQSQFKQYLAQSTLPSQYESQDCSFTPRREYDCSVVETDPVQDISKPKTSQNKTPKPANTLQVQYYGPKKVNQPKQEKKGQLFNIVKKRKLYNEKDFQDF